MNSSLKQIDKYNTPDYQNLYRHIKTYNLLNQLYHSDSISKQQFQNQQIQILSKFNRLKQHIGNTDLQTFIDLYDLEQQYKRIIMQKGQKGNQSIQSLAISLTSKFIEITDHIELCRDDLRIKNIINLILELTTLLKKYEKSKKKLSSDFLYLMKKVDKIYQVNKKKNLNELIQKIDVFEIEDTIQKLKNQFVSNAR